MNFHEGAIPRGEVEEYPAGKIILREGERGDNLYVIDEGEVQAFRDDDPDFVLARLGPGQQFGEMAAFHPDARRNASVRALTDVSLRRIPHSALRELLGDDHPLKRRLMARRDRQLREALQRRSSLVRALSNVTVRISTRTLAPGEILTRQGDEPGPAFIILAGTVVRYDESADPPKVLWRTGEGACVGERSVLEGKSRAATLVAETEVTVIVLDASDLRRLVATSPEWRDHVHALRAVYELPNQGFATQFEGRLDGRDTVTTHFGLSEHREVSFTRVVGTELFIADVIGSKASERIQWSDENTSVTLSLSATGELVGAEVEGPWAGQAGLARHLLNDLPFRRETRNRFEEIGEWIEPSEQVPAEALACACLVVPESHVRQCIADGADTLPVLQERTGCGTVCGGCVPGLATLLGASAYARAKITARTEIAPGIFHMTIRPEFRSRQSARPGQHVVLRGRIHGYPVQRAYTLVRADDPEVYEIAIKREPQGVFSRWITGVELSASIEVSDPGGHVVFEDGMRSVVCLVAGIGVTPAVAIAREVAERSLSTRLHIDLSSRDADHFPFGDELEALADAHDGITVNLRATGRNGRLDAASIAGLRREHPDARFYVCGPDAYSRHCVAALREAGLPDDRLMLEVFVPSGGPKAAAPSLSSTAGSAVGAYPGWTAESATFAPPRRFPVGRFVRSTVRAQRLVWRSLPRPGAGPKADPALPVLRLGVVDGFVAGLEAMSLSSFDTFAQRHGAGSSEGEIGRADGNTFVVPAGTPPVVRGCPVTTPWEEVFDGRIVPVHVTRGRTPAREIFENMDNFDRGPVPYHYLQQYAGSTTPLPVEYDQAGMLVGRLTGNATWREDRDLALRSLVPQILEHEAQALPSVLEEPLRALDERISTAPNVPLDAHLFTTRIAFRMVLAVLFGQTALAEVERAAYPIVTFARGLSERIEDLLSGKDGEREIKQTRERLMMTVTGIRSAVIEARERMDPLERERPYVQRMLNCPDEPAALQRLYAAMIPMLVAGHETTGTVMAWALYVLGKNPDLQERLLKEIAAYKAEHGDRGCGLVQQYQRPWMLAFLFELYRRYPPVPHTVRTAVKDGEMPPDSDTGRGAFSYRAKMPMMVSLVSMHRNPRFWPDPDRFDPTRFFEGAPENATNEQLARQARSNLERWEREYRMIPFSKGPSTCVGRGLNQIESFAFLDAFLSRFEAVLVNPSRVVEGCGFTISAPPASSLAITVRRRRA